MVKACNSSVASCSTAVCNNRKDRTREHLSGSRRQSKQGFQVNFSFCFSKNERERAIDLCAGSLGFLMARCCVPCTRTAQRIRRTSSLLPAAAERAETAQFRRRRNRQVRIGTERKAISFGLHVRRR